MTFRYGIESLFFVRHNFGGAWFFCENRSGRPCSTFT